MIGKQIIDLVYKIFGYCSHEASLIVCTTLYLHGCLKIEATIWHCLTNLLPKNHVNLNRIDNWIEQDVLRLTAISSTFSKSIDLFFLLIKPILLRVMLNLRAPKEILPFCRYDNAPCTTECQETLMAWLSS